MISTIKNTKKLIIDAIAMVGNIVGAALVASTVDIQLALIGYVFFLAGSLASIWLIKNSDVSRSLLLITMYFTVMNFVGIVTRAHALW